MTEVLDIFAAYATKENGSQLFLIQLVEIWTGIISDVSRFCDCVNDTEDI